MKFIVLLTLITVTHAVVQVFEKRGVFFLKESSKMNELVRDEKHSQQVYWGKFTRKNHKLFGKNCALKQKFEYNMLTCFY